MSEPIIIDDIDVSECRYFFIDKNKKTCSICLKECKSFGLCYYKTLKRIEKVCKSVYGNGLDEEVDKFDDILNLIDKSQK